MDKMIIEEHKQEMIAEAIPLYESFDLNPAEVDISFTEEDTKDGVILRMTTKYEGEIYSTKSRNITQLNG